MKKIVLASETMFFIPVLLTIIDYSFLIKFINSAYEFFGISTGGTHLSLGAWSLPVYLLLFPLIVFIAEFGFQKALNSSKSQKYYFFGIAGAFSFVAWRMCVNDSILINLA
ncbi:hypothetical protein OE749_17515 [Aestuariibacter sp. AA17]|uniref:Uncharacterized protein n=1 Tax=Fluctibacter corallii TaxID=2984329 RepID=A0ABT3ACY5_9ALTE|nr:hypothetical protein [Aestuariibacter sp. AA17]MCV2886498.1 hypothetical protein [Aestuariibacter sp. AA17]